MKLNLEIEANCVGCMVRYLNQVAGKIAEQVTVLEERPEGRDLIELEYECEIQCDGYSGSVVLEDADEYREVAETWESVARTCHYGTVALDNMHITAGDYRKLRQAINDHMEAHGYPKRVAAGCKADRKLWAVLDQA